MSWGITSPVRTFVQPVGKTLQTLLGFINKKNEQFPCSLKNLPDSVSSQTRSWHPVRPCWPAWARAMPGNVLTFEQLAPSQGSVQVQALVTFRLLG